jgi:hypothetical protein
MPAHHLADVFIQPGSGLLNRLTPGLIGAHPVDILAPSGFAVVSAGKYRSIVAGDGGAVIQDTTTIHIAEPINIGATSNIRKCVKVTLVASRMNTVNWPIDQMGLADPGAVGARC